MKHKTIADFFNDLSQGEYLPLRSLSRARVYAVLCLFILSMSTVYAQPKSQCVIEDNGQDAVLECDVSFSLLLTEAPGAVTSNAWVPDSTDESKINTELERFAEIWCNVTAAHSRIREISVYTDATNADFLFFSQSGVTRAATGAFPFRKPSVFIFSTSYGEATAIAHEFAHAALKIYDEYRTSFIRPIQCSFPLAFHDTRNTLMGFKPFAETQLFR